jgi:hypothetical protein
MHAFAAACRSNSIVASLTAVKQPIKHKKQESRLMQVREVLRDAMLIVDGQLVEADEQSCDLRKK